MPGRVELFGKHVDYAGGRSLLTAVDRGFHLVARPRTDSRIYMVDANSGLSYAASLSTDLAAEPGRWTDYPATVIRRVARDFPLARTGMDVVMSSSLPSASGLSSSSALVIATWLPLAAFNQLHHEAIARDTALAGYLGAVENGLGFGPFPADRGVGTMGGSQDHSAILGSRADTVSQFRFLPVAREADHQFPGDWELLIASSGVSASKAGAVKERYNELSTQAATLLATWREATGESATSLLDVLGRPSGRERLEQALEPHPERASLRARLGQFAEECLELIPAAAAAIASGDGSALGRAAERSQWLAETVLRNQVPETMHLARSALELGAHASSAFGAGFGGAVWAVCDSERADELLAGWQEGYKVSFPVPTRRARFFRSRPAPGAERVR